jgi:hypothetical protein
MSRRPRRNHSASRSAAPGISLRRLAYVARPAGFAGGRNRPPACEDAHASIKDHQIVSEPRIFDVGVLAISRDLPRRSSILSASLR